MLYINVERHYRTIVSARVATDEEVKLSYRTNTFNLESRNTWQTFQAAKEVAAALGPEFVATDAGAHVSPRYDIVKLPKIGDKVSYAFNGDSYPCGTVTSISKSLKVIATSEGQKFYRVRESGAWRYNRTWSLQAGHVYKQNPSF